MDPLAKNLFLDTTCLSELVRVLTLACPGAVPGSGPGAVAAGVPETPAAPGGGVASKALAGAGCLAAGSCSGPTTLATLPDLPDDSDSDDGSYIPSSSDDSADDRSITLSEVMESRLDPDVFSRMSEALVAVDIIIQEIGVHDERISSAKWAKVQALFDLLKLKDGKEEDELKDSMWEGSCDDGLRWLLIITGRYVHAMLREGVEAGEVFDPKSKLALGAHLFTHAARPESELVFPGATSPAPVPPKRRSRALRRQRYQGTSMAVVKVPLVSPPPAPAFGSHHIHYLGFHLMLSLMVLCLGRRMMRWLGKEWLQLDAAKRDQEHQISGVTVAPPAAPPAAPLAAPPNPYRINLDALLASLASRSPSQP